MSGPSSAPPTVVADSDDAILLDVQDLHTELTSRAGVVRAVDGVSFALRAGETLGVVGESGCGKSITALSLLRLLPPTGRITGGSVVFEGTDLTALDDEAIRHIRGAKVAMIFQDPMTSLNPVLPIGRQLMEGLRLHLKLDVAKARARAIELLQMVGIPEAATRLDGFPHQFSGGMRQRVMIAMALACHPRLIIADEPTTALDVTIQAQILDLLRTLAAESRTALMLITHDLGVVAGIADRVQVMYAGKIVEVAPAAELFANPRAPYTWGLLTSVPRLDEPTKARLIPIEGLPPDLSKPVIGCRFATRCRFRRDICQEREPELLPVPGGPDGHAVRCWATQQSGWLAAAHWRHALAAESGPIAS